MALTMEQAEGQAQAEQLMQPHTPTSQRLCLCMALGLAHPCGSATLTPCRATFMCELVF